MEGLWKCIFAHKKTAPCELEGMSNFWGAVQFSDDLFQPGIKALGLDGDDADFCLSMLCMALLLE